MPTEQPATNMSEAIAPNTFGELAIFGYSPGDQINQR
jgi:hypothetical protein